MNPRVATGLDMLLREASVLAGRTYGLLGHGASITATGRPAHLALADSPAGAPAALFGPEHGYYGIEQDMVASEGGKDPWTGAPTVSLYGESEKSLRPDPQAFEGLEVLLIDLQDVGSRYYTYAATAVWAAEVALEVGLEVWILDRPNPLGGAVVEGNLPQPGYESFVGAFQLPVRHGLTLGELVALEAQRRGWPSGWRLWSMSGWQRSMSWAETGLPWIAPSPNMPTLTTALVYPGGCLVEGTELSEGRGTTRPFELVGAPGVDPPTLVAELERRQIPGITFVPTYFRPQFQKHSGEICGGLQCLVYDPQIFPAYRCGVELLRAFYQQLGDAFAWRRDAYEFVSDRPAIDLLVGGDSLRIALEKGEGLDAWIASWAADEASFAEERRPILVYS